MKKLLVTMMLCSGVIISQANAVTVLPKYFQTKYYVIGMSEDKGDTMQSANNVYFCKISQNTIINYKNEVIKILKIKSEQVNNITFYFLKLNNGVTWVVSKVPGEDNWVLIQTLNSSDEEVVRVLFEVSNY